MELKYEFYIGASTKQVWDILITPEGTRQILFGSVLHSTFEIGSDYSYIGPGQDGDETVHVYGKILAYEPEKLLSCTEHAVPSYRENHAEFESRMTMTLETVRNCTKLTLVNDQWTPDHPSFESTKASWWMILSNIKTLAETGKTLDFGW